MLKSVLHIQRKEKSHRSRWLHQILIGEIVRSYFYELFNRFDFSLPTAMQSLRADDYMTKPFSVLELIARVKTNIRRANLYVTAQKGFVIDNNVYKIFYEGHDLGLTLKEFKLLKMLITRAGVTVEREELYGVLNQINELNANIHSHIRIADGERVKLNAVLDNVSQSIIALDGSKRIVFANKRAFKMFNGTHHDIGRDLVFLIEKLPVYEQITAHIGENFAFNCAYDDKYLSVVITTVTNEVICDDIKYNKDGGSVTVSITETDTGVCLKVEDTGIGIEKEHLPRLCERFYLVDKSHSKRIGGTGLGLAIVKHICAISDAELSIESEFGVGTTVTVVFGK